MAIGKTGRRHVYFAPSGFSKQPTMMPCRAAEVV